MLIHKWKILNGCSPNDINIKFCHPSRKGVRAKVPSLCKSNSLRNQSSYDHHLQSKIQSQDCKGGLNGWPSGGSTNSSKVSKVSKVRYILLWRFIINPVFGKITRKTKNNI